MRSLETANAHVVGIQVEDDDDNAVVPGVRVVSVRVKLTDMKDLARIAGELERRSEVDRVEWSEGSLTGFAPSARAA